MLYLLDADSIIRGDRDFYPLQRFAVFWRWLAHQGQLGNVKIPLEQFEEVIAGKGALVDWLNEQEVKAALLLAEEASPEYVSYVTVQGYGDLNEDEIELVGRDPFLIAYAAADIANRTVVTFEVAAPGQKRGKRKIPDVCNQFEIKSCNLYAMINALDFTTDWLA